MTTEDLDLHEIPNALEAVKVWRAAKLQADAAKKVLDVAGIRLAQLLGNEGAARIGSSVVRYRKGYREQCIDSIGFMAYVEQRVVDGYDLIDVFNPDYAKKSWMDQSVRDTFFEKVNDDEPSLQVVPYDRAPRFLQSLEDGEVLIKQRPEEER